MHEKRCQMPKILQSSEGFDSADRRYKGPRACLHVSWFCPLGTDHRPNPLKNGQLRPSCQLRLFGLLSTARKLFPLVELAQLRPWKHAFLRTGPIAARRACRRPILIQPQRVGLFLKMWVKQHNWLYSRTGGNNGRNSNGFASNWLRVRPKTASNGQVFFNYFGWPSPSSLVWRSPMPTQFAIQLL